MTAMIAGFPVTAWLLLLAAVVPGLSITAVFYIKHRASQSDG